MDEGAAPPPARNGGALPQVIQALLHPARLHLLWLAVSAAVAAVVLGLANYFLPIVEFNLLDGPSHWRDLHDPEGLGYEQEIVWLPFAACGVLLASALALAGLAYRSRGSPRVKPAQGLVGATVAMAGLLMTVAGTRWMGFVAAREAEGGGSLVDLGFVPYIDLGAGLVLAAVGSWSLAQRLRGHPHAQWAATSAALAGAGLAAMPLRHYAYWNFGGGARIALDDFMLAVLGEQSTSPDAGAPELLMWIRVMFWVLVVVGLASAVSGPFGGRAGRWLTRLVHLNGVAALMGSGLLVVFYERLVELRPNIDVVWNPIPAAALAGTTIVWLVLIWKRWKKRERSG